MEHIHSTHNNIYKISLAFIRDEVSEIFFIVHEELFYKYCRVEGVSLLTVFVLRIFGFMLELAEAERQ